MHKVISKTSEKAMVGKGHRTEHKNIFVEPTLLLVEHCRKHRRHFAKFVSPPVELVLHRVKLAIDKASLQPRRRMMYES